jgi:protein-tyrosine-phosphatase
MRRVLFVCNHNAGRSQMAHAFFERYAPEDFRAESAGSHPAREVWPEVVEAMAEVGIDIAGRRPAKLGADPLRDAARAACRDAGQHPLQSDPLKRIARAELRVAPRGRSRPRRPRRARAGG